ncbi:hypothetical protein GCM10007887_08710 [Methylobacterium haplocladii]|uniref:BrnT family toxin n=2 Tax=Methylobacterium haplocladii TaxID=1176176 RepID=A0A512IPM3_9HYPH|nr:BrnT family toxin [Methylobacterium haplocladii]GEO99645.1 hypothetical protein MHA02_20330 [Methylobacterium haplocladii]GJD83339.1 hypothetical protein HPGCJGGD_1205 [Methylobacterium haplocladii]GLS58214.1 hypothetical protein GCM10007887_08710 [Methylobacterium haplocladii]
MGMYIVWDEPKRLANQAKHGLDFAEFEDGFDLDGCTVHETRASRTGRSRFKLIGLFRGRLVTAAIVSPLGSEALSIVSFRRASPSEIRLHERS